MRQGVILLSSWTLLVLKSKAGQTCWSRISAEEVKSREFWAVSSNFEKHVPSVLSHESFPGQKTNASANTLEWKGKLQV
jgi:hypothetical protein